MCVCVYLPFSVSIYQFVRFLCPRLGSLFDLFCLPAFVCLLPFCVSIYEIVFACVYLSACLPASLPASGCLSSSICGWQGHYKLSEIVLQKIIFHGLYSSLWGYLAETSRFNPHNSPTISELIACPVYQYFRLPYTPPCPPTLSISPALGFSRCSLRRSVVHQFLNLFFTSAFASVLLSHHQLLHLHLHFLSLSVYGLPLSPRMFHSLHAAARIIRRPV